MPCGRAAVPGAASPHERGPLCVCVCAVCVQLSAHLCVCVRPWSPEACVCVVAGLGASGERRALAWDTHGEPLKRLAATGEWVRVFLKSFAFNSTRSVLDQGLPKGGHYDRSTTVLIPWSLRVDTRSKGGVGCV